VRYRDALNAQWVTAPRRVSPAVLLDLFERSSGQLADPALAEPLFRVRSVTV
jgi:hypothetical protein